MVDYWKDQSDPTDTGKDIDSDYLSPDSKPAKDSVGNYDKRMTDGGQEIFEGASNTQESQKVYVEDHEESEEMKGSAARTTAEFESTQLWELHAGHEVERAADTWSVEYYSTESKTLTAMASSVIDNPGVVSQTVELVLSDDRANTWSRWHNGQKSRVLGYMAYVLGDGDTEGGVALLIENADTLFGLEKEDVEYDAEYAAERFS